MSEICRGYRATLALDCSNTAKWMQTRLMPIKKSFIIMRKSLKLIIACYWNIRWGKHIYTEPNSHILDRNIFVSRSNKSKSPKNKWRKWSRLDNCWISWECPQLCLKWLLCVLGTLYHNPTPLTPSPPPTCYRCLAQISISVGSWYKYI